MIVDIEVRGNVHLHINEETGLDDNGVDQTKLINSVQMGESSPEDVRNAVVESLINLPLAQHVMVLNDDKRELLAGNARGTVLSG